MTRRRPRPDPLPVGATVNSGDARGVITSVSWDYGRWQYTVDWWIGPPGHAETPRQPRV